MIEFPDPSQANEEGLLAVGGNLNPETLMAAYSKGIFPWYGEGQPILWWSPDPRMVLFPSEFHCSRRLARRMRQGSYTVSFDRAFSDVIRLCAEIPRKGESGTWIIPEMIQAYCDMFDWGYAHSVEVLEEGELIGGLYGVLYNRIFFAESMFSRKTDASKVALAALCERAIQEGWRLIDCQFHTGHLQSLGAREISRSQFLSLIDPSRD
ncbi:leucyl/phenylalanyl-tRNA--protein transferase [Mariprofundus ferrinatatus]|uniref:Leucyl/phenylalanyl-tRNA--protein transferase n=1 Tax=Mariprofundus ferrinatatus TaxID=1921087 RepID=A0A2K8LBP4_9PROT|nr:leucyl/phenylalanyl-tRNA--protein transferase [Mariprofundus ferrinatatus]ATX81666.1 leucyl/phenylalanyl-tRNA--protein transferase [Mariprofundus ferrinatatus]